MVAVVVVVLGVGHIYYSMINSVRTQFSSTCSALDLVWLIKGPLGVKMNNPAQ